MDELRGRLTKYPSNFQLYEESRKTDALEIKKKLLLELPEYDIDMELNRAKNLISFLCFIIAEPGKTKEHMDYNEDVLKRSPENIVTLSNKAWFLFYEKKYRDCDRICKKIAILYDKAALRLIAEAEIAHAYARFGPIFCERAKELYENVLEKLKNGHNIDISSDYVCVWMFGYALAQKRSMNIYNTQNKVMLCPSLDIYIRLTDIYCRIIKLQGDRNFLMRYRAKAYVGLVWIVENAQNNTNFNLRKIFRNYPDLLKEPDDYIEEALNMSRDVYVLIECEKQFRYTGRLDKSIEILKEAVKSKSTSAGHHHLALSLKLKLEKDAGHWKFEAYRPEASINDESDGYNSPSKRYISSTRSNPHKRKHEKDSSSTAYCNKKMRRYANCDRRSNWHNQRRKSRTRKRKHHRTSTRNSRIKSMIKNPKSLRAILYDKHEVAVDEIFLHLNKAIKINGNTDAMFEKGILWRQLGTYENALHVFKSLLENKSDRCSRVTLANVYEQTALCIKHLLDQSSSKDEKLCYDMRFYFKSSVEISAELTEQIPSIKHCWKSPKDLETTLLNLSKTKETLTELLYLFTKTRDYAAALKVVQQLQRMAESEDEKVDLLKKVVQLYLNLGHYKIAADSLSKLRGLPEGSEMIDEKLYRNTHIEAGFEVLREGHVESAKQYVKKAFIDIHTERHITDSHFGSIPEEIYDVMIVCDPDNDDKGRKLKDILGEIGLHVTLNTDSKPAGTSIVEMTDVMEKSNHFAILFDGDITGNLSRIKFYITQVQTIGWKRTNTSNIVMIKCTDTEIPPEFSSYDFIDMDLENSEKYF